MVYLVAALLVSLLLVLGVGGLLSVSVLGQMSEKDRWFHGRL